MLKNVEDNDDSVASGSLYHHLYDDIDDEEGSTDINVAPGDIGRGRGRGRGQCRGGRGRGRGRGASVPEEYYTGMKVSFPPDT
jgi:hypothetical protein